MVSNSTPNFCGAQAGAGLVPAPHGEIEFGARANTGAVCAHVHPLGGRGWRSMAAARPHAELVGTSWAPAGAVGEVRVPTASAWWHAQVDHAALLPVRPRTRGAHQLMQCSARGRRCQQCASVTEMEEQVQLHIGLESQQRRTRLQLALRWLRPRLRLRRAWRGPCSCCWHQLCGHSERTASRLHARAIVYGCTEPV